MRFESRMAIQPRSYGSVKRKRTVFCSDPMSLNGMRLKSGRMPRNEISA